MRIRSLVLFIFVSTVVTTGAFAQASRTWVSGVGDDANPCSRTAPCKTFAGAISKTAPNGQISVLDPGGFGAVTITKAITLDGAGTLASITSAVQNAITINAGVNDNVTIRNLQIDGLGTGLAGVNVLSAKSVTIDHVAIFGMGDGGNGRGVQVNPSNGVIVNVYLHDMDIYRCGVNGVRAGAAGTGVANLYADDVRIAHIGTTTAHDGIDLELNTNAQIKNSRVFRAAGSGLKLGGTGVLATVDDSFFIRNGGDGIQVNATGAAVRLSNSTMTQNASAGVRATLGSVFSYRNNHSSDNGALDAANTQQAFY
jgi:hypothetical protein